MNAYGLLTLLSVLLVVRGQHQPGPQCHDNDCGEHGKCHEEPHHPPHDEHHHPQHCKCDPGYTGDRCEHRVVTCQDISCGGHGLCHEDPAHHHAHCDCEGGFFGDRCENRVLTCHDIFCGEHGRCLEDPHHHVDPQHHVDPHYKPPYCECEPGYSGEDCTITPSSSFNQTRSTLLTYITTLASTSLPTYSSTTPKTMTTTPQTMPTATHTIYTSTHALPTTTKIMPTTTQSKPTSTQDRPITTKNIHTTTLTMPTTTSVRPTMSSATGYSTCEKISTVMDLGNHKVSTNPNVTSCPSGSFATPEAFVIDHCNVTSPSNWTQGANVGMQKCGQSPSIIHIENGGVLNMNPHLYFTV